MKSNFKYVAIFIISSLLIIFIIQLFSLWGFYKSIGLELDRVVTECINEANTDELQYRADSLENIPKSVRPTGEVLVSIDKNENNEKTFVEKKRVMQENVLIDTTERSKSADGFDSEVNITKMIRAAMHQALDPIIPIDLQILGSSLTKRLENKKIKVELYRIEIVNFETDSVLHYSILAPESNKAQVYDFTYDLFNNIGYRVHMESLTKNVLNQMLAMLASTFAIFVLLGLSFWYLIRTILQQKTLEEMKDDFTNNMTHELKTPIAVAYSATDVLLNFKQGDTKEKRDKYLTICKEQLEKLEGLVEQILSMSTERHLHLILKKEDIRVAEVIDTLVEQHRLKANKKLTFNINILPKDLAIHADRGHLNNILSNLIDNAIKHSDKEETIINININRQDGFNVISVEDNGIGIASDKQKFLFEKFYRVPQGNKHNTKGYGLGLFYVKTIVEKHSGTINVESSPNEGSIFTIKMPLE